MGIFRVVRYTSYTKGDDLRIQECRLNESLSQSSPTAHERSHTWDRCTTRCPSGDVPCEGCDTSQGRACSDWATPYQCSRAVFASRQETRLSSCVQTGRRFL